MLIQQIGRGGQCQAGLANTTASSQCHQPLMVEQKRIADPFELGLASHQRPQACRKVRSPDLLRTRRRKERRTTTVDDGAKQKLGRRKILEPVRPQRLGFHQIADQRPGRARHQQLTTMSSRRNPRGAMHLQTNIARVRTLHITHVQPHPHPQLTHRRRPRPRPQTAQRRDRSAHRRPRVNKRDKKPVTLRPFNETTLLRDRATNNRIMVGQHPRPRPPKLSRQPRRTFNIRE